MGLKKNIHYTYKKIPMIYVYKSIYLQGQSLVFLVLKFVFVIYVLVLFVVLDLPNITLMNLNVSFFKIFL